LLKSQAEAAAAINPNSTKLAQTNKTQQQKRRKMGGDAQAGVVFFFHNCAMGTASARTRDTNTIGLLECDHATFRIHCTKCDEERTKKERERERERERIPRRRRRDCIPNERTKKKYVHTMHGEIRNSFVSSATRQKGFSSYSSATSSRHLVGGRRRRRKIRCVQDGADSTGSAGAAAAAAACPSGGWGKRKKKGKWVISIEAPSPPPNS
jgi:hypothetical protein